MVFGWLKKRKKKNEEESFPEEVTTPLPDDLERFKVRESEPLPTVRETYPRPLGLVGETERKIEADDKMDLILQKLETIDVRLKLLEEKLGV
ncbi:MAG: hypothetical protein GTN36_04840 [Candidatus Aenigmarchaeota archaeon]|nr:hypothetical protein [Candidatus Aenigmarchaeota archaeon]